MKSEISLVRQKEPNAYGIDIEREIFISVEKQYSSEWQFSLSLSIIAEKRRMKIMITFIFMATNKTHTRTSKQEEEFLDFRTFTSLIISGDNRRMNRIEKEM